MQKKSQKSQSFIIVCAFLLGLNLGLWLSRNAKIVRHELRCHHMVYLTNKNRLGRLQEELQRNRAFLLVAVFVNTQDNEKTGNVYNDFNAETDINYIFFATKTTLSSYGRQVIYLKDLDGSTETEVIYLQMFRHISQQFDSKFNWVLFTESSFFVNIESLSFLRNLNHSNELLLIPEVTRNSGVTDYKYDGQTNGSRIGMNGSHGINIDHFAKERKEYRIPNMGIFHPGIIMSRSLKNKLSTLTELCVQKTHNFQECFLNSISISWLNDFSIKNSTGTEKNILDSTTCSSEFKDLLLKTVTANLSNNLDCLNRIRVQLLSRRVRSLSKNYKALLTKLKTLQSFISSTVYDKITEIRRDKYSEFKQKVQFGTMFTLRKGFPINSKVSWSLHDHEAKGVTRIINTIMNTIRKAHHENIQFHALYYGYILNQPISGLQYRLNIFTNKERHITRSTEEFGAIQSRILETFQKIAVTIVVPLAGRLQNFKKFMTNLERNILRKDETIRVFVVYFPQTASPTEHRKIFGRYNMTYTNSTFTWVNLPGKFARARALQAAVDFCENDQLLFFADVDLTFNTEFLQRCRDNTISKKQVYFPVMFKLFNPKILKRNSTNYFRSFHRKVGDWALYSFGPVCAYRDDIISIGGFNVGIKEWGYEDIHLFEKFISRKNYNVFRAADPGLWHIYHVHSKCDVIQNNIQRLMCKGAMLNGLASKQSLANYLLNKNYYTL